jgi:hypothetical protein
MTDLHPVFEVGVLSEEGIFKICLDAHLHRQVPPEVGISDTKASTIRLLCEVHNRGFIHFNRSSLSTSRANNRSCANGRFS